MEQPGLRMGLGWIKGSIYVLDRYHLSKYVTQATAHMGYTTPIMWDYIKAGDKDSVKELFKAIISTTESESKEESSTGSKKIYTWQLERNNAAV